MVSKARPARDLVRGRAVGWLTGSLAQTYLILSWGRHAKVVTGEELITLSLGRGERPHQTCEILRSC